MTHNRDQSCTGVLRDKNEATIVGKEYRSPLLKEQLGQVTSKAIRILDIIAMLKKILMDPDFQVLSVMRATSLFTFHTSAWMNFVDSEASPNKGPLAIPWVP